MKVVKKLASFKCWEEELTEKDVTVCWRTPKLVALSDITSLQIMVYCMGKTDTVKRTNNLDWKTETVVFDAFIDDVKERNYSLYGLEPNCAYRVCVRIHLNAGDNLSRDYTFTMGLKPVNKEGDMPVLESEDIFFMTLSDMDNLIKSKEDLEKDNRIKLNEGTKAIESHTFCQSEEDVKRYGQVKDQAIGFFKKTKKNKNDLQFQSIQSEVMAARQCKDWRDFVKCQSGQVKFPQPSDADRDKRIRRYILYGNSIDALDEIPPYNDIAPDQNGTKFFRNNWDMGPFYSWNTSYLQKDKDL